MIAGQYRQGDVLLSRVGTPGSNFQKLPDNLTEQPTENGVVVLAKGDSTGNPHFFETDAVMYAAPDGQRFVSLASEQPLRCPSCAGVYSAKFDADLAASLEAAIELRARGEPLQARVRAYEDDEELIAWANAKLDLVDAVIAAYEAFVAAQDTFAACDESWASPEGVAIRLHRGNPAETARLYTAYVAAESAIDKARDEVMAAVAALAGRKP